MREYSLFNLTNNNDAEFQKLVKIIGEKKSEDLKSLLLDLKNRYENDKLITVECVLPYKRTGKNEEVRERLKLKDEEVDFSILNSKKEYKEKTANELKDRLDVILNTLYRELTRDNSEIEIYKSAGLFKTKYDLSNKYSNEEKDKYVVWYEVSLINNKLVIVNEYVSGNRTIMDKKFIYTFEKNKIDTKEENLTNKE